MQTSNEQRAADSGLAPQLAPHLALLLASGAGLSVAALYYAQPMLGVMAAGLGASERAIGLVPTLTQAGYAAGILLLVPLGDRLDRRRLIAAKSLVLSLALLAAAVAPSLTALLVASLVVGLAATLAQDIVPAAAALASARHRGRLVGTVMTGLLLGILLSRVVSGWVAEHFGWRSMYLVAALSVAASGLCLWQGLPRFAPTTGLRYTALMASLAALWRRHRPLRQAALAQGLLAVGFSAFWSTLALMLHGAPFHMGPAQAGAFGLAGAAAALAAPIAGRLADRHGPVRVARGGMGLVPLGVPLRLAVLAAGAVGFDLGFQAALIAHQTLVYAIDPPARSRLNALLFVAMFTGMATGAALGGLAFAQWGWQGVMLGAAATAALALALRSRR
jgi:predicted MFS family arabinose efflux permease